MYYRGKRTQGKLLENGFHGLEDEITREIVDSVSATDYLILDVGTGSGRNIKLLAKTLDTAHISSLDPSHKALDIVRSALITQSEKEIALMSGVAESLPFRDGCFDLIICVMSLHHINRPDSALSEMSRSIKEEGKILIVDWTPAATKLMSQPPSHFLSPKKVMCTIKKLGLRSTISEYSKWYITRIQKCNTLRNSTNTELNNER